MFSDKAKIRDRGDFQAKFLWGGDCPKKVEDYWCKLYYFLLRPVFLILLTDFTLNYNRVWILS